MWVRGHLGSLKITPLNRSYTISYQSAIVSFALCCTISELFDAEEYRDLEVQIRGSHSLRIYVRSLHR